MKTYAFALLAAATSFIAADAPRPPQPAPLPTAPTDLIAPAGTREKIIRDFQAQQPPPKSDRAAPARNRREPAYVPRAPLDLIGRKVDRDKLIQEFRSRLDAEEDRTRRQ